jgi:membrane associated rhomboid family serine protease
MAAEEKMYCYRHPDRETGVSCSECGRGICPDCMVFAPVGIRCPDHAGVAQGKARVTTGVRRAAFDGTGALVTKTLIALNVLVFLANLAQGSSFSRVQGSIFEKGALYIGSPVAGGLADGEWWRLITSTFLHAGLFHLGLNMLVLWFVGAPVEQAIGRGRYLALYIVSGLAGSAGALLLSPDVVTVGASGAIFGILGAALVLEAQGSLVLGGQAFGLIAFNLVLTFVLGSTSNISIGGHLGGLAGGALAMLALSRFGRTHAIYGRPGLIGVIGLIAVGAGAVLVAYLRVQGATA